MKAFMRNALAAISMVVSSTALADDWGPPPFNADAAEAAIRYELRTLKDRLSDPPLLCLAVGDGNYLPGWAEPPAALVARLADLQPAVAPFSRCPMAHAGTPVDKASGRQGTLVTIWSTKCAGDSICDVDLTVGPDGYGNLDTVERTGTGWSVTRIAVRFQN
jgi:hypothetical protein